jgi:hypothetical protein
VHVGRTRGEARARRREEAADNMLHQGRYSGRQCVHEFASDHSEHEPSILPAQEPVRHVDKRPIQALDCSAFVRPENISGPAFVDVHDDAELVATLGDDVRHQIAERLRDLA